MHSPQISSPKRSLKRHQLNFLSILSILRWAFNDKNTNSSTSWLIVLSSDWLFVLPGGPTEPRRQLIRARLGKRALAKLVCCGWAHESTWTNETPLKEKQGKQKGCLKAQCSNAGASQRCLFVPWNRKRKTPWHSANIWGKQMWSCAQGGRTLHQWACLAPWELEMCPRHCRQDRPVLSQTDANCTYKNADDSHTWDVVTHYFVEYMNFHGSRDYLFNNL